MEFVVGTVTKSLGKFGGRKGGFYFDNDTGPDGKGSLISYGFGERPSVMFELDETADMHGTWVVAVKSTCRIREGDRVAVKGVEIRLRRSEVHEGTPADVYEVIRTTLIHNLTTDETFPFNTTLLLKSVPWLALSGFFALLGIAADDDSLAFFLLAALPILYSVASSVWHIRRRRRFV